MLLLKDTLGKTLLKHISIYKETCLIREDLYYQISSLGHRETSISHFLSYVEVTICPFEGRILITRNW